MNTVWSKSDDLRIYAHCRRILADPGGPVLHLKADLSMLDNGDNICLELKVVQHVGTLVDLNRMLDGALRHDWASSACTATAVTQDPLLIKRVNHALHGWQCILMPTLVYALSIRAAASAHR